MSVLLPPPKCCHPREVDRNWGRGYFLTTGMNSPLVCPKICRLTFPWDITVPFSCMFCGLQSLSCLGTLISRIPLKAKDDLDGPSDVTEVRKRLRRRSLGAPRRQWTGNALDTASKKEIWSPCSRAHSYTTKLTGRERESWKQRSSVCVLAEKHIFTLCPLPYQGASRHTNANTSPRESSLDTLGPWEARKKFLQVTIDY